MSWDFDNAIPGVILCWYIVKLAVEGQWMRSADRELYCSHCSIVITIYTHSLTILLYSIGYILRYNIKRA